MTYECPNWYSRINETVIENGMDVDSIYDQVACNEFSVRADGTIDQDGTLTYGWDQDHEVNPECPYHGLDTIDDSNSGSYAEQINEHTGLEVCMECETVWLEDESYTEHLEAVHDGAIEPASTWTPRTPLPIRPPQPTLHSDWTNP